MRPKVVVLLCVLAVSAVAGLIAAADARAGFFAPEEVLTPSISRQLWPAVSGRNAVYMDNRNGNWDIYLYDLSAHAERRLTTNGADQTDPDISGSWVVWVDERYGNMDIYAYDLRTNAAKRLTAQTVDQFYPAVSGSKVVWQDQRDPKGDIYLYDLATNTSKRLTTDPMAQARPDISGTRVVYQDGRHGNWEIYLYDLTTGREKRLPEPPGYTAYAQRAPRISGTKVVFQQDASYNLTFAGLYDVTTRRSRALSFVSSLWGVDISGSRVVATNAISDYYVLVDLATEESYTLSWSGASVTYAGGGAAFIDGTRIVYEEFEPLHEGVYPEDVRATRFTVPHLTGTAPAVVPYGSAATVSGTFKDASGVGVAGATLTLQSSKTGTTWAGDTTIVTGPEGAYSVTTPMKLSTSSYFRVRSARDSIDGQIAVASTARLVRPKVSLSTPSAWATVRVGSSFTASGYLRPRHRPGSYPVVLQLWRSEKQASGIFKYILKRSVWAKASDYATYTKYAATLSLPAVGKWRIRAVHPQDRDNAETLSSWRYVEAK